MWHLCGPYLFLISPTFGALGGLCFAIVVFPGYVHFFWGHYLCLISPSFLALERVNLYTKSGIM